MGRFFGTLSDETAAEFEKAAAAGGMEYQGDLEALSFLHYGGYCGFTSLGTAVVPADVAKAYDCLLYTSSWPGPLRGIHAYGPAGPPFPGIGYNGGAAAGSGRPFCAYPD